MAYQTGTATDYRDLLDKLRLFLTTDATLVGLSQNWEQKRWVTTSNTQELFVRGPGLAGTDNIYIGIRSFESVVNDYYNLGVRGSVGLLIDGSGNYQNGADFHTQPGTSPEVYACAFNTSMPYWFVANGRRFIAIWKVSTTYHGIYCGFPLPYATPAQYPYPLMVCGTGTYSNRRWSVTTGDHRMFHDPGQSGVGNDANTYLYYLDGTWQPFANYAVGSTADGTGVEINNIWPKGVTSLRETPDGSYALIPFILNMSTPNLIGELDGVYWIPGFNTAAEDTMTIASVPYVIFQNIFRTSINSYFALKLA